MILSRFRRSEAGPARVARWTSRHWGHRSQALNRDNLLDENRFQVRTGNAPALRNLAITALRLEGIAAMRDHARNPDVDMPLATYKLRADRHRRRL